MKPAEILKTIEVPPKPNQKYFYNIHQRLTLLSEFEKSKDLAVALQILQTVTVDSTQDQFERYFWNLIPEATASQAESAVAIKEPLSSKLINRLQKVKGVELCCSTNVVSTVVEIEIARLSKQIMIHAPPPSNTNQQTDNAIPSYLKLDSHNLTLHTYAQNELWFYLNKESQLKFNKIEAQLDQNYQNQIVQDDSNEGKIWKYGQRYPINLCIWTTGKKQQVLKLTLRFLNSDSQLVLKKTWQVPVCLQVGFQVKIINPIASVVTLVYNNTDEKEVKLEGNIINVKERVFLKGNWLSGEYLYKGQTYKIGCQIKQVQPDQQYQTAEKQQLESGITVAGQN